MKAEIKKETDDGFGLLVTDNNGTEHKIGVCYNGEIDGHLQDDYPDQPSERTPAESEHVNQARRFARYYVHLERGYDTVPPELHPERIDAVREAIASLSDAEFDALFADLQQQLRSYHDDTERAIPIPAEAAGPNSVLYRQHVYLGVDPTQSPLDEEVESLASAHGIDLEEAASPVSALSDSDRAAWQSFSDQLEMLARDREIEDVAVEIGGVSSLYTAYVDARGEEHIGAPEEDPFERAPDTMIELAPIDPGPLAEFREYFDHYLQCQIRDCFVRMGLHPPEEYCVLGPGRIEAAEQYKTLEMYPDFTDPENEALLASN